MNKFKTIFFIFVCMFIVNRSVKAYNYVDLKQYDFSSEWEEINLELNGYMPIIQNIIETKDGSYIMKATYKETGNSIPGKQDDNTSALVGTATKDHTKIIKYDKDFNKIFEKNFYVLLNSDSADPLAPTVATELSDLIELKDGSLLGVGYVWGLTRDYQDDNFDAIFIRIDNNGEELHRKVYYNQGLEKAISCGALVDGGYVIKFYYSSKTDLFTDIYGAPNPTEFDTSSNEKYYYVVYNSNNEIVDSFSESNKEKLNSLQFIDNSYINNLKYKTNTTYLETEYYIGDDIAGNANFIKVLDNFGRIKNIYSSANNIDVSKFDIIGTPSYIFFNDNSVLFDKYLFDSKGEYVTKFNSLPDGKHYFIASNGTIINYEKYDYSNSNLNEYREQGYKIYVKKPASYQSDSNYFDANFIIDGEKINYNLGTFLENNRTYINLNNLCSAMKCNFSKSSKNENKIILRFDILNNKKLPENFKTYSNIDGAKYTIVHEIGSKTYQSYLELFMANNSEVFALKSPTFQADSVDVTSKIVDNQVYVPLRFVAEALGRYVEYNPSGENNKPTITISSQGEGEFYDKYDVGITYSKLEKSSMLVNNLNNSDTVIDINDKPLYAYGYETSSQKIINTNKTIFFPLGSSPEINIDNPEEVVDNSENTYYYNDRVANMDGTLYCENNSIYQLPFDNTNKNDEFYEEKIFTVIAVSNIEGYPFIRLINVK